MLAFIDCLLSINDCPNFVPVISILSAMKPTLYRTIYWLPIGNKRGSCIWISTTAFSCLDNQSKKLSVIWSKDSGNWVDSIFTKSTLRPNSWSRVAFSITFASLPTTPYLTVWETLTTIPPIPSTPICAPSYRIHLTLAMKNYKVDSWGKRSEIGFQLIYGWKSAKADWLSRISPNYC